jgi:hypothetical protein
MPPRGTFTDTDPTELVGLLEQTVLRSGTVGRLLRRIDSVVIRPASADQAPCATISRPGIVGKAPHVFVVPSPNMTQEQAQSIIAAAGLEGPHARESFGQYVYDFAGDVSGEHLVSFALAALRAVGAQPADGRWEYQGLKPERA